MRLAFLDRGRFSLGWGYVAFPKHLKDGQEGLGTTLTVQDHVLLGLSYRHGNFSGIGIKRLDELRKCLGVGGSQLKGVLGHNVTCLGQAIAFPVQLPEPSPSGAGAGWAIGVALP